VSQRRRLTIVLSLNLAMIVGLVLVGISAHSLGVLAAGGDYVADSTAIGLGILAVTIRDRVGEHSKAPTVVAGVNATALLAVSIQVLTAGIRRLVHGTPHVHGLPVLVVSALATAVMVGDVFVLGTGAGREDLHMRSVLLDTISDAVASAAVAASGLVIYLTDRFFWLDSALSVAISVIIGAGAARLLRDVVRSLSTGAPLDLDDNRGRHRPPAGKTDIAARAADGNGAMTSPLTQATPGAVVRVAHLSDRTISRPGSLC
jgi:cobalt-zinc-cadmium efflux system protein